MEENGNLKTISQYLSSNIVLQNHTPAPGRGNCIHDQRQSTGGRLQVTAGQLKIKHEWKATPSKQPRPAERILCLVDRVATRRWRARPYQARVLWPDLPALAVAVEAPSILLCLWQVIHCRSSLVVSHGRIYPLKTWWDRDLLAAVLKEVSYDVSSEPALAPLTGEAFPSSANSADDARVDIAAKGFWKRCKGFSILMPRHIDVRPWAALLKPMNGRRSDNITVCGRWAWLFHFGRFQRLLWMCKGDPSLFIVSAWENRQQEEFCALHRPELAQE